MAEQDDDVKEYRVSWHIDVSAASPQGAAQVAQSIQRDVASTATVFNVRPYEGEAALGEEIEIDLGPHHWDCHYMGNDEGQELWSCDHDPDSDVCRCEHCHVVDDDERSNGPRRRGR